MSLGNRPAGSTPEGPPRGWVVDADRVSDRSGGPCDVAVLANAADGVARDALVGGPRPSGWLLRKLRRERVEPRLSVAAAPPSAPERWVGYLFVGDPGASASTAVGAGMAVVPEHRRRGIARAMLERALARTRNAGFERLRCLSEPGLEALYLGLGFRAVARRVTLATLGEGPHPAAAATPAERPGWPPPPTRYDLGWCPEIWRHTPAPDRFVISICDPGVRAWGSIEAGGWLIQGVQLPAGMAQTDGLTALLTALPGRVPAGVRALLYGLPAPLVATLASQRPALTRRWDPVQRFAHMERFTRG